MILKKDNEIDQKLANFFQPEAIENIKYDSLGYLGMNITDCPANSIDFKIYYKSEYCVKNFKKYVNCNLLDKFGTEFGIKNFEIVQDKKNINFSRYNIKLLSRENENMNKLFLFLSKNVPFFNKYKQEITQQSTMRISDEPDLNFASLLILGIIKHQNTVNKLKCYWLMQYRERPTEESDKYYLEFLQKNGNQNFKQLLPLVEKALTVCRANLWLLGVDYNAESSEKHKIYFDSVKNLYEGLEQTLTEYTAIQQKLAKIKEWNEQHPEFYCENFALGKDKNNNLTLNIYFKLKISKLNKLIEKLAQKKLSK